MTNPESTAIDPVAAMGTDHTEAPAHPLHKVLSFVRRSGRLDDRLQRAWDNYAGTYLLDIAAGNLLDVREGVTLDRAFVESAWGNDNPLIVEIGTGQGENVVAAAAAHPETNFLALEVYDPGVAHTLLLAGKQGLTNIRVAQVNAPDLRAGAALVIAGLAADGYTVVDEIGYIQRGYECFEEKLQGLGAMIEKVDSDRELQKFKLRVG